MTRRSILISALVGAAGLLAMLIGAFVAPVESARAWLVNWSYFFSIAAGALFVLGIGHAMGARWFVLFRRFNEAVVLTLPLLAVLFVPIFFALPALYPWAGDFSGYPEHVQHVLHHRHVYMNAPFFIVRAAIFLGVLAGLGMLLTRWSFRQDADPDPALQVKMRRLGSVALPISALALTFGTFDWFMSLEPAWFSSMYGIIWFAGGFMGAVSLILILAWLSERSGETISMLGAAHYHAMGKLMLTFVVFWAYVAFSQLIIIYMADLPEEVTWYITRFDGGWGAMGWLLAIGHFVVPFFILLNWALKRRGPVLAAMGGWLLVMHYVDVIWILVPSFQDGAFTPHWTHLAGLLGIGGTTLAFAGWRMLGRSIVPRQDPYFEPALKYESA